MSYIQKQIKKHFFTPILAIKKRYIPLLLIYFAYGAQGLIAVALTFWEKENLNLSAEQFLMISVWVGIPFTLKMIIGQMVDTLSIFGSRRKIFVFLGATLMTIGYFLLYEISVSATWIEVLGSQFNQYLAANLMMVLGFMIQDVTADTMSTEVVDRTQTKEKIQKELALIQILGRLSLMIAATIVAGLGGYLAENLAYSTVFLCALIIPIISILGTVFIELDLPEESGEINPKIFFGGILFGIFTLFMAFNDWPWSQEIILFTSLCTIIWMLLDLLKNEKKEVWRIIVFSFLALFVFRAAPSVGPGYNWWSIDVLGFDPVFFGILRQIGSLTALIFLWIFSDVIARKPVRNMLLILIGFGFLLDLPNLMLYYGLNENLGLSAQTVALFDTALESPLAHISMIPMLTLIAFYAPPGARATWFAVSASLMNLALTTGTLFTKYLNQWFLITREIKNEAGVITTPADYSELGILLWISILISLIFPLLGVLFFLKKKNRSVL